MDNKELKEVAWYHSSLNAWFVSAMASDCLMAIFFLVCLVIHLYFHNAFSLNLCGVSFSILGIACIISTFAGNKKYIESLINNKEPESLKVFDIINRLLFVANSACLLILFSQFLIRQVSMFRRLKEFLFNRWMRMNFLDFARLRNSVPLHKHDFEVISRKPLLPIVDRYQEEQIAEKCKICGATETNLKYGPIIPKLKHLDYIG